MTSPDSPDATPGAPSPLGRLASLIHQVSGVDPERVTADVRMHEDLGISGLEFIEIVVRCEAAFAVRIDARAAEAVRTPGQLLELIDASPAF